jgi:hypothetical protein
MILRENLIDIHIPRRDKMREAILGQWQKSFEVLKHALSVSSVFCLVFLHQLTSIDSNPAAESASLRMVGQARI